MTAQPLHLRLYREPALIEAARIIGYGGIEPFGFWDAAKKLGMPQQQIMNAVYDLTRTDRREASPPRYELREDVKKFCWQLLGPPPSHELHGRLVEGPRRSTPPRNAASGRRG